jgi:hypothetical protein
VKGVQIVCAREFDLKENENRFDGFLGGLLCKPGGMPRHDIFSPNETLGLLEILLSIATPATNLSAHFPVHGRSGFR